MDHARNAGFGLLRNLANQERPYSMSHIVPIAFAILLVFASAVSAQQDNPIIARMNAFAEAYNAQDAQAVANFYAEDAALFLPGQPVILGRDGIAKNYAAAFAKGVRNLQFKVIDIRNYGSNAAYEISDMTAEIGEQRITGRYMHMWEVIDGQILLTRDFFQVISVE
ncbi:YybH family protein [Thiorhodovibrio frisius]|nr:SgcJ/EcaC family oxidoreductase [Thiorhodovibrio frisius]